MPSGRETYLTLVAAIIEELERGEMPWRRPWVVDRPRNLYTRKPYTGINVLGLMLAAKRRGYRSSDWITEKQARKRDGYILPSELESPAHISMMHLQAFTTTNSKGNKVSLRRLVGRSYPIYNFEQTRGLGRLVRPAPNLELWDTACERIVQNWNGMPTVIPHSAKAFYRLSTDVIGMPDLECFDNHTQYYATLFHEMVHSTGHATRLNRATVSDLPAEFGSESYALEELVAELGAAFLCSEAGIGNLTRQNNTAYIGSWLKVLRRDKGKLFHAAFLAERACDHVLGRVTGERKVLETKSTADNPGDLAESFDPTSAIEQQRAAVA